MSYTAIVDYGVGNLKSVTNAMRYLGLDTCITGDEAVLERADAIILPGVGAFPDAAERLRGPGLDRVLVRQAAKKPILGICLGMQLLFDVGEEVRECRPWSGPWKRPADQDGPKAPPYRLEQPEPPESLSAVPGTGGGRLGLFRPQFLRRGRA